MQVTAKSTKSEIWQAYQALLNQQQQPTITAQAVANTAAIVSREAIALARDIQRLGSFARQRVLEIVEIYNKPILRAE